MAIVAVSIAPIGASTSVGSYVAELLEASGVDTIKELRNRNAENLAAKMEEVNAVKNLCNSCPSAAVIQGWIDQAKQMDPKVAY